MYTIRQVGNGEGGDVFGFFEEIQMVLKFRHFV
jgi:hypothetical protein